LLVLASVAPVAAQISPFTKVADTTSPIPGRAVTFLIFSNMVSMDANGDGAFSEDNFDAPANDGTHFWSSATDVISRVADLSPPFRTEAALSTNYLFSATVSKGEYSPFAAMVPAARRASTPTIIIANGSTVVPGIGGTYSRSSQLGFDDGNITFESTVTDGTSPANIIGGYTAGELVTVATAATIVPGLSAPFTGLRGPADLSGSTVVSRADDAGGSGFFTADLAGGPITPVVRTVTPAPGGAGNSSQFFLASIDGEVVAFRASIASGVSGVYLRQEADSER